MTGDRAVPVRSRWLRTLTLALAGALAVPAAWAAADDAKPQALRATVSPAAKVHVTPSLRDIKTPQPPKQPTGTKKEIPIGVPAFLTDRPAATPRPDPLRKGFATSQAPALGESFEGVSNDDNTALFGGEVAPPDTQGDVGGGFYFQWVNLAFQVYDTNGVPQLPFPFPGNVFWPEGTNCGDNNAGDPVVLFDHLASRWLFTQFTGDGTECVALSNSADPLGSWFAYEFPVTPGANNDYPKLGVWTDGYYMTSNIFTASFQGVAVTVFERDAMLQGQPARFIQFILPFTGVSPVRFSLQPSHFTGKQAPPDGTCNFFVQAFDDETWGDGGNPDGYQFWEFCTDWDDPASSTFDEAAFVTAAAFDAEFCGFAPCVPQPGTAQLLDVLGQFTMYRATVKYFADEGELRMVLNHTVDLNGSSLAGIRWTEFELAATPTIIQTGTIAPGDGQHRWMGSIAYDASGNIGMVYSRSGGAAGQFPSILYTGHEAGVTPAGQMQAEGVCQAGGGSQTGSERWGDYSSISVDPDDGCTFWLTSEYHPVTDPFTWHTRICSFKFASCTAEPAGTVEGTVTDDDTGDPIEGALVQVGAFSGVTDADGEYSIVVGAGTYDITASRFGYTSETVTGVAVADGATVVQDFTLVPLQTVDLSGTVTDGSGAGWPLWARITITSSIAGQPPIVVYTNPADGTYEVLDELFADTDYDIEADSLIQGYLPETRTITTPASGTVTEDFELEIDGAACEAPGYAQATTEILSENFSAGIPGTWTVVDNSTACGATTKFWNTGTRPVSTTIGTVPSAFINSDACGSTPSPNINTDLITPNLNLSGLSGSTDSVTISFASDYRDLCTVANTDAVSLDVWNGTAWEVVFNFCGQTTRRNRAETFGTQAANGLADAKFRFHYDSGWDWWWVVDDVTISTSSCSFQGGGLIWGFVTDANTGDPVVGASVDVVGGGSTTTVASPDPNTDDGIYFVAADTGLQTVEASAPGYGTASDDTTVTAGQLSRLDLALPAGLLAFNPDPVNVRVPLFTTSNLAASVDNDGNASATWTLFEVNSPAPPAAPIVGLIQTPPLRVANDDKLRTFAPTARNHPARPVRPAFPTIPRVGGDVSAEFDSGLPGGPYGNGLKHAPSLSPATPVEIWLGNLAALSGDDVVVQYSSNGLNTFAPTGTEVANPPGATFWADATYNHRTGTFWQVNVGGDNCIHEFDAAGFTGESICPVFLTTMRGLTYDPITDTYYAGSFNDGAIVQFSTNGTIIRRIAKDVDVVGLAFNPLSGRLYAMQNTAAPEPDVVVMDANSPTLDVINTFDFTVNGVSVMGDFEQAGLDIDCRGRLWGNNFITGKLYVSTSGENNACADIPWLTVTPSSGTTAANSSTAVNLGFDANLAKPGLHRAHLVLSDDTPYGSQNVEVNFTAAFLDVSAADPFDRFIHGLAGAGITAGCGNGNFCPGNTVTRGLMPVWLLPAKYGSSYKPPKATGTLFSDVPAEFFGADYIEQFFHLGITAGCGTNPLRYCPNNPVTRGQMAVFLLVTLEGPGYAPPPATGIFADVPAAHPLAPWIEELFNRGITAGCGTSPLRYCPASNVSRGQMAVFVTRMFDIPVAPAP